MNPFNASFFISLILLSVFQPAHSKVIHWPDHCESGELKITNNSSTGLSLWLQKFNTTLQSESEYNYKAQESGVIKIDKTDSADRFSVMHFADEHKIQMTYECGGQSAPVTSIYDGIVVHKKTNSPHHKLRLQNLHFSKNTVTIELLNSSGSVYKTKLATLEASESVSVGFESESEWKSLRLKAENRFLSFLLTEKEVKNSELHKPATTKPDASYVYFLVSPRDRDDDSFVIRLNNSDLIEKARQILKNPDSEKIVFAKVVKGHNNFNRNFNNAAKARWSWSVSEVTGFDDFGSIVCNGHPQALEDRVESWSENPGRICFWDYRLKKELALDEVSTGHLK